MSGEVETRQDNKGAGREPVIEIKGVSKTFFGVVAVRSVDLNIYPGEVIGLVGKNGAGKSTLINVLGGAIAPTTGAVVVGGTEMDSFSPHNSMESGIAVVHQQIVGARDLSVAENIDLGFGYPKRFGLVSWGRLRDQTRAILAEIGVDIEPTARFGDLTVAEQRMVTIARALARNAQVLILDEPSASLTDQEIVHLHEIVHELRARGVAIIYVSHRLDEVLALSDRIVVMRDGRVVADQPREGVDHDGLVRLISKDGAAVAEPRAEADVSAAVETAAAIPQTQGATPDAAGEVLLRARGVVVPGKVHAVDLDLRAGEILGIAGLAGSGRTELVRALFGAESGARGEIQLLGKDVRIANPRQALGLGIALLPEDRHAQGLIMDFSVARNISLASMGQVRMAPGLPFPSATKEAAGARELIESLGIVTHSPEAEVRTLSGGNQQKVVLAKWLKHGAHVYIFDEPTNGVDVDGKSEVYAIMRELAAAGKGVIFISSEFAELVEVCDRVIVLREGSLVSELSGDEISEDAILEDCYQAAVAAGD